MRYLKGKTHEVYQTTRSAKPSEGSQEVHQLSPRKGLTEL